MALMPDGPWGLMNLLFHRGLHSTPRPAATCLRLAGCSVDQLLQHLHNKRMVEARRNGQLVAIQAGQDVDDTLQLRPSSKGYRWISSDPHNMALWRSAYQEAGKQKKIHEAVKRYDVAPSVLADLHNADIVRLVWADTGQLVAPKVTLNQVVKMAQQRGEYADRDVLLEHTRRGGAIYAGDAAWAEADAA